jgi:hypothetical protein
MIATHTVGATQLPDVYLNYHSLQQMLRPYAGASMIHWRSGANRQCI